jgi:uncharacterized integral membrane protein
MPEKTVVKLIIALVICIMLIAFALQNFQQECRIRVLFWTFGKWPVSIIIFVSILIGVLIAVCEILPHVLHLRRRAQEAEDALARLKANQDAAGNMGQFHRGGAEGAEQSRKMRGE